MHSTQIASRARVVCAISPAQASGELPLSPGKAAGLFEAEFKPPKEGSYRLKVTAWSEDNTELGTDELPLAVVPYSAELDKLARDDSTLKQIAKGTDGDFADIAALPDLIDRLIARQLPPTETEAASFSMPDYRRPWSFALFFLLFTGLLTAEWLLRRQWQMQ